jgi:hypothetical protein
MTGHDILHRRIGQRLTDGIFQSFVFNGQISSIFNVVFLKFDLWLTIATTEEETFIKQIDTVEQIKSFSTDDNSTFEYPLSKIENEFPDFKKFIGQTLHSFNELIWIDSSDISGGLKLCFENGLSLTLYDEWKDGDNHMNFSFDNKLPDKLKEKINA